MAAACSSHPSEPSVVACDQCERGMCADCDRDLGGNTCASCQLSNADVVSNDATVRLIATCGVGSFLGLGGGVIWASTQSGLHWIGHFIVGFIVVAAVFGGFAYGWRAVKDLSQGWIMTPQAWLWFFIIQISLAMCIGPFLFPFGVATDIKNLKRCSQLRQLLQA